MKTRAACNINGLAALNQKNQQLLIYCAYPEEAHAVNWLRGVHGQAQRIVKIFVLQKAAVGIQSSLQLLRLNVPYRRQEEDCCSLQRRPKQPAEH